MPFLFRINVFAVLASLRVNVARRQCRVTLWLHPDKAYLFCTVTIASTCLVIHTAGSWKGRLHYILVQFFWCLGWHPAFPYELPPSELSTSTIAGRTNH